MRILLAGGGTAGHIEPALAVARALQRRDSSTQCVFIGTASGLENTLIPKAGFEMHLIPKVSIPRSISPALLAVPLQLIASVAKTMRILKDIDCAIGFGGYVSGPLYIAAALTRTPFVIHEQNAKPGWANRMGAYLTSRLAISYPVHSGKLSNANLTGLPLREDVRTVAENSRSDWNASRNQAKANVATKYSLNIKSPLVFIFGGSQGSQAINQVIQQSLPRLESMEISIIHGVGGKNPLPSSQEFYKPLNYIEEMAELYLAADLIIARSGAVTCAEVSTLGRFALFVPLPVGNGEQALNAEALVVQDRAEIISQAQFNSDWLSKNIERLLEKSSKTSVEGDLAGLHAADMICELVESAAGVR